MGDPLERCAPAVAIVTMGCAKNEVDSARMSDRLRGAGYRMVDDAAEADAIIVNTCSFIQDATEESLDAIFDLASLDRVACGDAKIIVAGCMPARYGDDLADELSEAAAFVPCRDEEAIAEVVERLVGKAPEDARIPAESTSAPQGAPFSYVKISDGCDRWCSYCTIPAIRGRYHSFPYDDIERDVRAAVDSGSREIVLIAQDTGRWGRDFEEPSSLAFLVSRLAEAFPDTWFRVMYIQPEGVTADYIEAVASHPNVCDYFDIPLQHVDPDILASMNRTGSREEFESLAQSIRDRIPDAALRTTLIAGYPGETDEQFASMLSFVEEGIFDYVGVFPYSQEDGTRAAKLACQLSEDVKLERAQRVRDAADEASSARVARRIGMRCAVLIEGEEDDGQLFGRAMCQAPEVDGCTYVDGGQVGDIVEVEIVDTLFYEMEGEVS